MNVEYMPLLQIQRDLYSRPRDMNRVRAYLGTMLNDAGDDLEIPPLVAMNPMAREHVPRLLDDYLAIEADEIARRAIVEAGLPEAKLPGALATESCKLGLVVVDDLLGGWTNRYATEFQIRFAAGRNNARTKARSRFLMGALWSSEPASESTVRQTTLLSVWQFIYRGINGPPQTVGEMIRQIGFCLARSGAAFPDLNAAELDRARQILSEHLDARDMPTAIACLFGDEGAASLGFTQFGLPPRAGDAVGLDDFHRAPRESDALR